MTSITHLHQESKVLPLKEHGELLGKQFLASSFVPGNPGRKQLGKPAPARNLKKTILIYENEVRQKYQDSGENYKTTIKQIHTEEVGKVISSYKPNRVLKAPPPEVNPEESDLNRKTRTRLARLRSGFCQSLNQYMSRIDTNIQNICPLCNSSPHDTEHLFSCSKKTTDLTVMDLWTRPKLAADFLDISKEEA